MAKKTPNKSQPQSGPQPDSPQPPSAPSSFDQGFDNSQFHGFNGRGRGRGGRFRGGGRGGWDSRSNYQGRGFNSGPDMSGSGFGPGPFGLGRGMDGSPFDGGMNVGPVNIGPIVGPGPMGLNHIPNGNFGMDGVPFPGMDGFPPAPYNAMNPSGQYQHQQDLTVRPVVSPNSPTPPFAHQMASMESNRQRLASGTFPIEDGPFSGQLNGLAPLITASQAAPSTSTLMPMSQERGYDLSAMDSTAPTGFHITRAASDNGKAQSPPLTPLPPFVNEGEPPVNNEGRNTSPAKAQRVIPSVAGIWNQQPHLNASTTAVPNGPRSVSATTAGPHHFGSAYTTHKQFDIMADHNRIPIFTKMAFYDVFSQLRELSKIKRDRIADRLKHMHAKTQSDSEAIEKEYTQTMKTLKYYTAREHEEYPVKVMHANENAIAWFAAAVEPANAGRKDAMLRKALLCMQDASQWAKEVEYDARAVRVCREKIEVLNARALEVLRRYSAVMFEETMRALKYNDVEYFASVEKEKEAVRENDQQKDSVVGVVKEKDVAPEHDQQKKEVVDIGKEEEVVPEDDRKRESTDPLVTATPVVESVVDAGKEKEVVLEGDQKKEPVVHVGEEKAAVPEELSDPGMTAKHDVESVIDAGKEEEVAPEGDQQKESVVDAGKEKEVVPEDDRKQESTDPGMTVKQDVVAAASSSGGDLTGNKTAFDPTSKSFQPMHANKSSSSLDLSGHLKTVSRERSPFEGSDASSIGEKKGIYHVKKTFRKHPRSRKGGQSVGQIFASESNDANNRKAGPANDAAKKELKEKNDGKKAEEMKYGKEFDEKKDGKKFHKKDGKKVWEKKQAGKKNGENHQEKKNGGRFKDKKDGDKGAGTDGEVKVTYAKVLEKQADVGGKAAEKDGDKA
ncbi:hypothetical protein CC80DRAFT_598974 [Byssothecium circinans]|uniref:Uncharacterized protein n=1 Tax=Byssothecium circinans TaxID=147558 RepID=A0A6A5T9M7_9PLEO|nr:hypothetical protein CC80DRAFT_598974 [Byssothecium circinans]